MKEKTLNCIVCDKEYVEKKEKDNGYWRKTCSDKCLKELRSPRITKVCVVCEREYKVIPYRADKTKTCSKKCLRLYQTGVGNPNWKGGLDVSVYSTKEWKEARQKALERDEFKCLLCEATETLNVHHVIPYRLIKNHDLVNLVTLCSECHSDFERDSKGIIKELLYGHPTFTRILCELWLLHQKKNRDYATKDFPLGNFERVGMMCKMWGIDFTTGNEAEKVAFVYALKQVDAVGKLLGQGAKGNVEDRSKRYDDIAVYSVIARILFEEGK